MKTFVLAIVLATATSLIVAGLFLPFAGMLEGGEYNCLNDGVLSCVSMIPLSALIYGPLFTIVGTVIGTPVFMLVLEWRRPPRHDDRSF